MGCMYLSTHIISLSNFQPTHVQVQILQSNSSEMSGDTDLGQAVD